MSTGGQFAVSPDRHEGLDAGELLFGKPEVVRGHEKLPTDRSLNQISGPT